MIDPPRWTAEQLEAHRRLAVEDFRRERMEEPLETYLDEFDKYQGVLEDLLEATVDFRYVEQLALEILTNEHYRYALRYLPGPPISEDDLETLIESKISSGEQAIGWIHRRCRWASVTGGVPDLL